MIQEVVTLIDCYEKLSSKKLADCVTLSAVNYLWHWPIVSKKATFDANYTESGALPSDRLRPNQNCNNWFEQRTTMLWWSLLHPLWIVVAGRSYRNSTPAINNLNWILLKSGWHLLSVIIAAINIKISSLITNKEIVAFYLAQKCGAQIHTLESSEKCVIVLIQFAFIDSVIKCSITKSRFQYIFLLG